MTIGKKKKEKDPVESSVVAVPQTVGVKHPFMLLDNYNPLSTADMALYKSLREAVPIIDAAIYKIVRLIGSFTVSSENRAAEKALSDFLKTVNVSGTRQGQAWHWNLVKIGGAYYHLDLLSCHRGGAFRLLTDDQMSGYDWDYSAHPASGES